jgi:hypothetical protein
VPCQTGDPKEKGRLLLANTGTGFGYVQPNGLELLKDTEMGGSIDQTDGSASAGFAKDLVDDATVPALDIPFQRSHPFLHGLKVRLTILLLDKAAGYKQGPGPIESGLRPLKLEPLFKWSLL